MHQIFHLCFTHAALSRRTSPPAGVGGAATQVTPKRAPGPPHFRTREGRSLEEGPPRTGAAERTQIGRSWGRIEASTRKSNAPDPYVRTHARLLWEARATGGCAVASAGQPRPCDGTPAQPDRRNCPKFRTSHHGCPKSLEEGVTLEHRRIPELPGCVRAFTRSGSHPDSAGVVGHAVSSCWRSTPALSTEGGDIMERRRRRPSRRFWLRVRRLVQIWADIAKAIYWTCRLFTER